MKRKPETGALLQRMDAVMREKRLFLNKDLSRAELAREAMTNRTYVSRALKAGGQNFASFVNAYRVQYALELLLDGADPDLSQEDIAVMSGFSCADTMNRYIKKSAGSTACAVRERVLDG